MYGCGSLKLLTNMGENDNMTLSNNYLKRKLRNKKITDLRKVRKARKVKSKK